MHEEIENLVTWMHDGLCGCGGRCFGWHDDYNTFLVFVEDQWGSAYPLNAFIDAVRKGEA